MGNNHKPIKKHKAPQQSVNQISDGLDIEFSQELADHDDLEAQQRSKAADERAKQNR